MNFSSHHGSTCVFVFFIGTYALCCNLGDSIAILLRKNDKRVYLSRDFTPKRELEKQRIELKNVSFRYSEDGEDVLKNIIAVIIYATE